MQFQKVLKSKILYLGDTTLGDTLRLVWLFSGTSSVSTTQYPFSKGDSCFHMILTSSLSQLAALLDQQVEWGRP